MVSVLLMMSVQISLDLLRIMVVHERTPVPMDTLMMGMDDVDHHISGLLSDLADLLDLREHMEPEQKDTMIRIVTIQDSLLLQMVVEHDMSQMAMVGV
jgi:hypothetical protein